ncbi:YlbF family regulator [Lactobacillus sp. ESL0684]|uniref:YlbF family regulator n=1 Tax=unclassified Lactobacillus TaxID=2620435 RepID=UPI0023F719A5|nr:MULTISPECIES: YlbF family regulator [unclassified Lactobacillus]WEV40959.1 YlbF family regulator [Lactobacillus sp. ESL0681]WEV44210.1 YlbF family regulator [Lactobacillus sp. ESL0684]
MVNIYDSANELAANIQEIDEYKALSAALDDVKQNATSLALFKEMDQIQSQIMNAQAQGEELSQELQDKYQKLDEKVQKDATIMKLLQAEQGLYKIIDDVQKTLTKPINDLYNDLRK